ncbi:hypothetical protein BHE90_010350 [Fusarium euwallaceae]|uniref:Uncharacterized protein n=1 Tax=Fusarium euwallaceae TaxID=1147111 RepID=A0A430LHL9_9HYPO|nr:hypothetical protein BHE90_010350 [Fusarium euwallaceae]
MRLQIRRLMASAVWLSLGAGLSLSTTNNPNSLASALIMRSGITVLGSEYIGAAEASGVFTDGFYNIKSGIVLSSGRADGVVGGDRNVDNSQPGYPGIDSVNAAALSLNIRIEAGYTGFELEFVFATQDSAEATRDAFFINILNVMATTFDISHPFMENPPATIPNEPLQYRRTSPPLLMGFTTGPGIFDVDLVVYDELDASFDSAALIRMKPCVILLRSGCLGFCFINKANQVSSSESIVLSTSTISPGRTATSQLNSGDASLSSTLNNPARTTGLVVEPDDASLSSTFNKPDQTSASALNSDDISLNPTLNPPDQTSATAVNSEDISPSPTLNIPEVEAPGDVSLTDLPPFVPTTYLAGVNPPPLPSDAFSMGNLSRAATLEAIVTTVVYTILDPHDPAYLTVAEFCTTLKYPPCRNCQVQKLPTVEMTTIQTSCDKCGYRGESIIELTIPLGANPALETGKPYIPDDGPDGSPAAAHDEDSRPEFRPRPRPGGVEARPTVVPVGHSPSPSKANGYGEHARPVIQHGGSIGEHGKERPSPGRIHAPAGEPGPATIVYEKPSPSQHKQVPSNDNGEPAGSGYGLQATKATGPGKDEAIVKPSLAPSAEATKAIPKPDPAGASAELKLSTVPAANIPSTPPDSPVIVAAGHVARGIDGVLTSLALAAGLFLVL